MKTKTKRTQTRPTALVKAVAKSLHALEDGDPIEAVSIMELALKLKLNDTQRHTLNSAKNEAESGSPEKAETLLGLITSFGARKVKAPALPQTSFPKPSGPLLFATDPHGEHRLYLHEETESIGNSLFDLYDNENTRMGFTGEELDSLCDQWRIYRGKVAPAAALRLPKGTLNFTAGTRVFIACLHCGNIWNPVDTAKQGLLQCHACGQLTKL